MTKGAGGLTRRGALALGGGALAATGLPPFAWAQGRSGLHGLSIFGDLKYKPGFEHFDYVRADAPKGGTIRFQPPNWLYNQNPQTFNTLNGFVLKGDAPPRVGLVFDTLMTSAADERDSMYGLLAESVDVAEDARVFTFRLRAEARFHDGAALTAEDAAFSLALLKEKGHPNLAQDIKEMVAAEALDARTLRVTLSGKHNRSTILTICGLPVFSKAYYSTREFDASTLDPPLGSGPYRIGRVDAGRFIEFDRVEDYWGRDLPVNVGFNNFDRIRIDFFTERQPAFEALKKGEITHREEFTSITWAQDYTFPSLVEGKVKKSLFPMEKRPSFQGWFINTRRQKFADPRTRQAIGLAFDFEWSNRNLFFSFYQRWSSLFENSDCAARGMPSPDERALLEPFRDSLPEAVLAEATMPPVSDGSGRDRNLKKQATDLFAAAGWRSRDGRLFDADGNVLDIEFLIDAAVFERVLSPYVANLQSLGIAASIRQVDPVQHEARQTEFDFDVVMYALSLSPTPIDGMQQIFGSAAAGIPGSHNLAGMRDETVDALLDRLPEVRTRDQLVAITRSIDRIFRAGHYWVPNWGRPDHWVAHWDIFGWPETKPDYAFTPETTWWYDRDKAAAIGMAG